MLFCCTKQQHYVFVFILAERAEFLNPTSCSFNLQYTFFKNCNQTARYLVKFLMNVWKFPVLIQQAPRGQSLQYILLFQKQSFILSSGNLSAFVCMFAFILLLFPSRLPWCLSLEPACAVNLISGLYLSLWTKTAYRLRGTVLWFNLKSPIK